MDLREIIKTESSDIDAKLASLECFRPDLDESGKELFDVLMECAREMLSEVEQKNLALSVA